MAEVIPLAIGAWLSRLQVNVCTKQCEAYGRNLPLRVNKHINMCQNHRLITADNASSNIVSSMRPGLESVIQTVRNLRHCDYPEIDITIAVAGLHILYAKA
jgi:hypothetical protein